MKSSKKQKKRRARKVSPESHLLAAQLCTHYHDALRGAMLASNLLNDKRARFETRYNDLSPSQRKVFRQIAAACAAVDADPREFVIAQFQRWAEVSGFKNKVLLPMPQHLSSLGAQARFVQYKLRKQEREDRSSEHQETEVRSHFVEERKLKGLVRVLRVMPEDVLAERPEEFSRAFLQFKQIWSFVKERWFERSAS